MADLSGCRYELPPDLGNWLNPDPIQEQGGLNLYGFVENDPITGIDLLGLDNFFFRPLPWISGSIQNAPVNFGGTLTPKFQRIYHGEQASITLPGREMLYPRKPAYSEYVPTGEYELSFGPLGTDPLMAAFAEAAPTLLRIAAEQAVLYAATEGASALGGLLRLRQAVTACRDLRTVEALATKSEQMLFRGVPGNGTQKAILGQQGVAIPRGTALDEGSLIKHVLGEDVSAGVTSWTTDRAVAARFSGAGGTIIEVPLSKVSSQVVPRPPVPKYGGESEVLLRGTVQGTPTRP